MSRLLTGSEADRNVWHRGVTLVELVLVILVLGLITLGTGPKFNAYYKVELRSAIRTLASDLRYAQSQAIATRTRYGLVFNPAAETYAVYRGDPSTLATDFLNPGDVMRRGFGRIDLVSASFDGSASLEFDAMGTPYATPAAELSSTGLIIVNEDETQDTVAVHPITGKVEIWYYREGGGGGCSSPQASVDPH